MSRPLSFSQAFARTHHPRAFNQLSVHALIVETTMEVLDALNLGEFAQYFSKMAMFPVFDLAYYIVSILYLKYEPGKWDGFPFIILLRLFLPIQLHETELMSV